MIETKMALNGTEAAGGRAPAGHPNVHRLSAVQFGSSGLSNAQRFRRLGVVKVWYAPPPDPSRPSLLQSDLPLFRVIRAGTSRRPASRERSATLRHDRLQSVRTRRSTPAADFGETCTFRGRSHRCSAKSGREDIAVEGIPRCFLCRLVTVPIPHMANHRARTHDRALRPQDSGGEGSYPLCCLISLRRSSKSTGFAT